VNDDSSIRAAIFDLGGVIIDIRIEEMLGSWARSVGVEQEQVAAVLSADTRHHALERGEISIRDYHAHVVDRMGRPLSFEEFLRGWNAIFGDLLPGVTGLLAQCRRFLRVVALSNTNAIHADVWRVRHADVLRHFERIFVSHEMGARKPEPECFRQVLEYLAVAPQRVVFIDDCAENVEAAVRLGMKGIVATGAVETARRLRDMGVPLDA